MVILRPFALKMSLTSCFVFSICLGVALHTANSSSLSRNKKRERARTALRSHARYHSYPIPQHNYFEVSSSYFFWGFALIFYIEALSSYLILRLRPHCYILRLCSSVWGFGLHCCWPLLLCLNLYCFFGLFVVICVWFCLFVFLSWVTRFKYYLAWIFIHFLYIYIFFYVNLFSLQLCNRYFGLHAATLIFISCFCWLPCFHMGGNYSPMFIVMGPI